jgi:hypothetical protein
MTTSTISQTDVVTAVTSFVKDNGRPCPSQYLTEKFGDDVLDMVDTLKESGVFVGLRGRNGGLALAGSEIVAKRAEYAAKKAAKVASAPAASVDTNEVAESSAA